MLFDIRMHLALEAKQFDHQETPAKVEAFLEGELALDFIPQKDWIIVWEGVSLIVERVVARSGVKRLTLVVRLDPDDDTQVEDAINLLENNYLRSPYGENEQLIDQLNEIILHHRNNEIEIDEE